MASYRETLLKTIIWRFIATSITILTGWLVSGNWKFGLAIGGIDTILKTIGYFTYERAWIKYSDNESNPDDNKYYFLYTVLIKNNSKKRAKLLSRHWIIKDDNGKVQDVKGEGVIGEQPDIRPGEEFQYTSGTMIETSFGTMRGSYHMIDDEDNYFDAVIPEFVLSIPRVIH